MRMPTCAIANPERKSLWQQRIFMIGDSGPRAHAVCPQGLGLYFFHGRQ